MILEIVSFRVLPGNEEEFLAAGRRHADNMTNDDYDCRSVQFGKNSDDLLEVTAVIHWESREAYDKFSTSEERLGWRKRIDDILSEPPSLRFLQDIETHYAPVV
jgi:quinol monooxygenase YgiN